MPRWSSAIQLGTTIGRSVIDEVASVCASADPLHALNDMRCHRLGRGIEGRFALTQQITSVLFHQTLFVPGNGRTSPMLLRRTIGLNAHAIDDRALSELAELADASVFNGLSILHDYPLTGGSWTRTTKAKSFASNNRADAA